MRILLLTFALVGCATMTPMQEKAVTFPTKSKQHAAFKAVGQALLVNGFDIIQTDASIGVIKAKRNFTVVRGLARVDHPAIAVVQVVMLPGFVRAQLSYQCRYAVATSAYSLGEQMATCYLQDKEANEVIQTIEPKILADLKTAIENRSVAGDEMAKSN